MDLDFCIEHARYFAQKMKNQDILIKKALDNNDTALCEKLTKEKDYFYKELVTYASFANYFRNFGTSV